LERSTSLTQAQKSLPRQPVPACTHRPPPTPSPQRGGSGPRQDITSAGLTLFPNDLPDAVEEAAVFGLGGALVMDKLHLWGDDALVLAEARGVHP